MLGIDRRSIQNFDWVLFGLGAVLIAFGIVNLISASHAGDDILFTATVRRQLMALGVGLVRGQPQHRVGCHIEGGKVSVGRFRS